MKKIVNGVEIDLTAEEIIQKEQDAIQADLNRTAELERIAQEQANKQSALNKLKALGLNDAEINSILGN
jgi:hypothetical protein